MRTNFNDSNYQYIIIRMTFLLLFWSLKPIVGSNACNAVEDNFRYGASSEYSDIDTGQTYLCNENRGPSLKESLSFSSKLSNYSPYTGSNKRVKKNHILRPFPSTFFAYFFQNKEKIILTFFFL